MSQNIYIRSCKCIWQIFTLHSFKCKKKFIHDNNISVMEKVCMCKYKWFTLTQYLHIVYMTIDTYMHNIGTYTHTLERVHFFPWGKGGGVVGFLLFPICSHHVCSVFSSNSQWVPVMVAKFPISSFICFPIAAHLPCPLH